MPSDRKPSLILPVAVAALLLLAGYVGAYYAMVDPVPMIIEVEGKTRWEYQYVTVFFYADYTQRLPMSMANRCGEPLDSFFTPIHWIDRRIRPHVWDDPE